MTSASVFQSHLTINVPQTAASGKRYPSFSFPIKDSACVTGYSSFPVKWVQTRCQCWLYFLSKTWHAISSPKGNFQELLHNWRFYTLAKDEQSGFSKRRKEEKFYLGGCFDPFVWYSPFPVILYYSKLREYPEKCVGKWRFPSCDQKMGLMWNSLECWHLSTQRCAVLSGEAKVWCFLRRCVLCSMILHCILLLTIFLIECYCLINRRCLS